MSNQNLIDFLPYFKKRSKELQNHQLSPFVVEQSALATSYESEMETFIQYVYNNGYMDNRYRETLNLYGCNEKKSELEALIKSADQRLLRAILTKMIRDERFISGAWIYYVEEGLFEEVIKRFSELN